jgi:WhiB family redox-sensing transcriptional regulator
MRPPCARDPELFFCESGGREAARKARSLCLACPLRENCLKLAIANAEQYGIWGGLSVRQRRKVRDGRATPEQFWRCRKGHSLIEVGVNKDGWCAACTTSRVEHKRELERNRRRRYRARKQSSRSAA